MTPSTACRFGAAVVLLVALASAGATRVAAADPLATIGATVTANVYIEQSRDLAILNRSTVPILVVVEPAGGWAVEPGAPIVLEVDGSIHLQVVGMGVDGARIVIRVRASDPAPAGRESAEIVLGARVYLEAPAPQGSGAWLTLLLAVALLTTVLATRRYFPRGPRVARPRFGHAAR